MSSKKDLSRIDILVEIERIKQKLDNMFEEIIILNQLVCLVAEEAGVDNNILKELCLTEVRKE